MAEQGSDCRSLFLREVQMFKEMVHVDGEKAYKNLVKSIKEISLRFVDDLRNATVPAVVRSIRRKDGQHFKKSLSLKYTSQADRFDPYAVEDEGWDEATQTLVSDIFQLAGSASETMSKVYGKINILRSKVRQETFLRVVNAIPLPMTTLTVLQKDESEQGLDVDKERIRDHMPRPAHFEGMDLPTKLLGALTHYLMRNNLCQVTNTYSAKKAEEEFKVGYTAMKRVVSGVKQKGGSAYKKKAQEEPDAAPSAKRQKRTPTEGETEREDVQDDKVPCKYCGKWVKSKELVAHIGKHHAGEKAVYACPYCAEPFAQYIGYVNHITSHKDKVIKCKTCGEQFDQIFALRKHSKSHVNQCPFCSVNFSSATRLQEHINKRHPDDPMEIERQCSLCDATYATLEELSNHMHEVHRPHSCNICFMRFSAEFELYDHRREVHQISSLGTPAQSDPSDRVPGPPQPATTAGTSDPADQTPEPPQQAETETEQAKPATPKKGTEVKGYKNRSDTHTIVCQGCNRYFRNTAKKAEHVMKYHKNSVKRCQWCNIWYLAPWDYNDHLDSKHVSCELCEGYLRDEQNLEEHNERHHSKQPKPAPTPEATQDIDPEDRPHECRYCDARFQEASELKAHVNGKHRTVPCPDCSKRFVTELDRDNHRKDSHGLPKFNCRIKNCKVFRHSIEQMFQHMRSDHWEQLRYRCNKCPFLSKDFKSLDKHHEKDHGREPFKGSDSQSFPCGKCPRRFQELSMLINHSKDHPENVHQCEECRWRFTSHRRLNEHCRCTHDTKHFSCDTCGKSFSSNDDLYRHQVSKHIHLCHICYNQFLSKSELKDHMNEVHDEAEPRSSERMAEDQLAQQFHERQRKKKKKKKKKKQDDDDDDDDEDEDETYYPSQDYGDDSNIDPEYRPSKKELKGADKEGDQ